MEQETVESKVAESSDATPKTKRLVSQVAVENCSVSMEGLTLPVLDISFIRLVLCSDAWDAAKKEMQPGETIELSFHLERHEFTAPVTYRGKGDGWVRFSFEKMVPSVQAHLRSFLSPKKIGESIHKDWEDSNHFHYHGLNESELWLSVTGATLFTYLDPLDPSNQFIVRIVDETRSPDVGKISRQHYMEMDQFESDLPLVPPADREAYSKISECRDIITNFRPSTQKEYHLKQKLLKVMSDYLYSTSQRYQGYPIVRPSSTPSR